MKIGIDSYCFHRFFGEVYDGQQAPTTTMTMDDFLAFARELHVDGVSLESCFLPTMDQSWLRELQSKLDGYAFDRVYAWGHPSGLEDGTNRDAFDDMISQIPHAALIGARVMRVTPGPGPLDYHQTPRQPRLDVLARWFKEAVVIAERYDVKLAAENHGDYTADEMLWLIEAVGSPSFGLTFDTGNFLGVGDDPVRAMEMLAPYTFATHIKDRKVREGVEPTEWYYLSSTPLGEGLVDIAAVVQLLKSAGYEGLLAVEVDYLHPAYHDEHAAVRQSIGELRRIVGNLQS